MYELRDYQQQAVEASVKSFNNYKYPFMVVSPTGCHRKGTSILMMDGSFKNVEDIIAGDRLIGPDGKERIVLQLCRGKDSMYEVKPVKGASFFVNTEHILSIKRTKIYSKQNKKRYVDSKAGNICDISVNDYLKLSKWQKHIHKLFRNGIESFGNNDQLKISPYFLGVLLGDGCIKYSVNITSADKEIEYAIYKEARLWGLRVSKRTKKGTTCLNYSVNRINGTSQQNPITNELKRLNLFGKTSDTKFIPFCYKTSNKNNRLKILAGLIDTDGCLSSNYYDYVSKSQQLAEDVAFIARSVGLAAYIKTTIKYCQNNGGGMYYRVSISGNINIIPCKIPRKKASMRKQKKDVLVTGFKVIPTNTVEDYYGFTLSGDGRYLLSDFTVTHNSGKSLIIANIAKQLPKVLILQPSKEILESNYDKMISYGYTTDDVKIYSASMGQKEIGRFTYATIGSIYRKPELFKDFHHIIIDECFVKGTKIDDKNIEELNHGDIIKSFNHKKNCIEYKKVLNVFKKPIINDLIIINNNVCTLNHPFYVKDEGYIEAKNLMTGDIIYEMRSMWKDIKGNFSEKVENCTRNENLLRQGMCKCEIQKLESKLSSMWCFIDRLKNISKKQSKKRTTCLLPRWNMWANTSTCRIFSKNENKKSNEFSENKKESIENAHIDRTQAKNTRWKWERIICSTAKIIQYSWRWMVYRIHSMYKRKTDRWISISLQNRYSKSTKNDSSGSGREQPLSFIEERTGQKEKYFFREIRVDCIKILKQGSNEWIRECEKSNYVVYNLEVEDNNNYFANGILVHNCHLVDPKTMGEKSTKGMYNKFFKAIGNPKIMGLTATPYRLVQKFFREGEDLYYTTYLQMLNRIFPFFFKKIVYEKPIKELFNEGYLCPIEYIDGDSDFDISNIPMNTTGGDFDIDKLESYLLQDERIAKVFNAVQSMKDKAKHILIFTTSLRQARKIKDIIEPLGTVACVFGETPKKEREQIIRDFRSGVIKTVINVGTLTCISDDTEILTRNNGWVNIDSVSSSDLIAQYDNDTQEISFNNPTAIHKKILNDNSMIEVDGRYISFKVTKDHTMLYKTTYKRNSFLKTKSADLKNRRIIIPVSGFAKEDSIVINQDAYPNKSRFIATNSYNYRKRGMSIEQSHCLANKMYNDKILMTYKNPCELTIAECNFIGFWLGDGSKFNVGKTEVRYSLCQSFATPKLIEWIEDILSQCNIHYSYKDYPPKYEYIIGKKCYAKGHRVYSLSKGTGGNKQKYNGLYSLLPYLKKNGTDLFWGLNREQFFALYEGLWKADGWHGNNKQYDGSKILGEHECLFSLLQSIGVCRGFRVTMKTIKKRKNDKKKLYNLSLADKQQHKIYYPKPQEIICQKNTRVWCVTMPKGTIVTRRKGTVSIMGNCGFDFPELDCVVLARPTMSLTLHYQSIGRTIRKHPLKPKCYVIDCVGNVERFGKIETIEIGVEDGFKNIIKTEKGVVTGKPLFTWKCKKDKFEKKDKKMVKEQQSLL